MKIELVSEYSVDLANELLAGALDLALAHEPPETPLLTRVQVTEAPFYIAVSKRHALARSPHLSFPMLSNYKWILFERRLHPPLYDKVMRAAERESSSPQSVAHVTAPEETFPFVADGSSIAFVVKAGALLLARNGVHTMEKHDARNAAQSRKLRHAEKLRLSASWSYVS
jgi:DNA-binding transcriptional LysR family regulator